MKKTLNIIIILFFIISCVSIMPRGWINNNTFRVYGYGLSNRNIQNSVQRKMSACRGAIIDAQAKVIQKLAGIASNKVSGKVTMERTKNGIITHFSGTIKGGSVVQRIYDPEKEKCTVVYEIRENNLRQKFNRYIRSLR